MNNIFIPKKINVGYQNRSDTYTGRLAYIIYYDQRGKLRKEASWRNWRDESIPNDEFDNIPTTGFVLNKKVGDYSSGWDHRHAYCRVYDPRNFEFEITIENLLYILENTSSIKGKGLEGEFVYGWDGKDLVLMPVGSPDYKQISEYNEIVHNKQSVKAKELIMGATYLSKENDEQIYMGKFDHYGWNGTLEGKMFWFAYKQYDYSYVSGEKEYSKDFHWRFVAHKNLSNNKFIKCIDSECTLDYADIFQHMEGDSQYSPYDESKDTFVQYTLEEFRLHVKNNHTRYYGYSISNKDCFEYTVSQKDNGLYICNIPWGWYTRETEHRSDYDARFEFNRIPKPRSFYNLGNVYEDVPVPITIEELYKKLQPCYKITYLQNGREKGRDNYYVNEEE